MGHVNSRHATSQQVSWSPDVKPMMAELSDARLKEIDDVLDFAIEISLDVFCALPGMRRVRIDDSLMREWPAFQKFSPELIAKWTALEKYRNKRFVLLYLPCSRPGIMVETQSFEVHMEVRSQEVHVRLIIAKPRSPDDNGNGGGTPAPKPRTPFWHKFLTACHGHERVLDPTSLFTYARRQSAAHARKASNGSATEWLSAVYEDIVNRSSLWFSFYEEQLKGYFNNAVETRIRKEAFEAARRRLEVQTRLIFWDKVDACVEDLVPASWWNEVSAGGFDCVRAGPVLTTDRYSFALVPNTKADEKSRIYVVLNADNPQRFDHFYLLMCGSLSKLRQQHLALSHANFYIQYSEALNPHALHQASEILGTLRRTFPIRMRYRRDSPNAATAQNVLEVSCAEQTARVLADYFDEAERRLRQGEHESDVFMRSELPTAVSGMKVKDDLNVFCNIFSNSAAAAVLTPSRDVA